MGCSKIICGCRNVRPNVREAYETLIGQLEPSLQQYVSHDKEIYANLRFSSTNVVSELVDSFKTALGALDIAFENRNLQDILQANSKLSLILSEMLKCADPKHLSSITVFETTNDCAYTGSYLNVSNLLGGAFEKAVKELEEAVETNNLGSVAHHSCVITDIVGEALLLRTRINSYYTEELLNENHPHKIIMENEE